MTQLEPRHTVSSDTTRGEVSFVIAGFWTADKIRPFLAELDRHATPIALAKRPIHAIGDMSDFVPQGRDTAAEIADHLQRSKRAGLRRVAIIDPPPLVKLQYKRVSEGIEVEFFETEEAGRRWLYS